MKALKLGLDIKPLFESEIMQQRITRENFKNAKEYYSYHKNPEAQTCKYTYGIINLMYSQVVYLKLFGSRYEGLKDMKKIEKNEELRRVSKMVNDQHKQTSSE